MIKEQFVERDLIMEKQSMPRHLDVITAGCKELYGSFSPQRTPWGNTSDSSVSLCSYNKRGII